jgi:hypothetical protein
MAAENTSTESDNCLYSLAESLLAVILSASTPEDCDALERATIELRGFLERIHPDLEIELIHIAAFREEKVGPTTFTTPVSAIDHLLQDGISRVREMLERPGRS